MRYWNIYLTYSGDNEGRLFNDKPLARFSITALLRDLPSLVAHNDALCGILSFRIEEVI